MMNINGYGVKAIRSDGLMFNYENQDWAIISVEGIDSPQIEVFREAKGIGNGDIITGQRRMSREIKITLALRNFKQSTYGQNRSLAVGFHNNNYTYDLLIAYLGSVKIAKSCVIKAVSYPTERYGRNAIMTVLFLSPDADLYADNTDSVSFVTTQSLWHDTRAYTPENSLAFGQMVQATEKVINYIGSEPAPIVVTIRATGYVNGCRVSVGDFEAVIATELHSADVLIIDAEERLVSKNGTPVPEADYDAAALTELKLGYGDNIVTVDSDSTAFSAEVDYVGRYGGI